MSKRLKKLHIAGICMWLLLAIPTIIWWKDAVLWVAIMSIYANIWLHVDGYGAARAEEKAEN